MICNKCWNLSVAGRNVDCDQCYGLGIHPLPQIGAMQAAIEWLRLELTEMDRASVPRQHALPSAALSTA